MRYVYTHPQTRGRLILTEHAATLTQTYEQGIQEGLLAIAWNRGEAQEVQVDEAWMPVPAHGVITLMSSQTYRFEKPEQMVLWQFNRDFYCIVDHDVEVSCAGFLFFGTQALMRIHTDTEEQRKLQALLDVFIDEVQTPDTAQGDMLRMLLKRLIIRLTRRARAQHLDAAQDTPTYDLVRQFALLVEQHYHTRHQVQDYADLLHRSPKTLSNVFAQVYDRSPLQVIQDRITLEAKRLLRYTDRNVKEIAFDLGFDHPAHFSRFFKRQAGVSPTRFRDEPWAGVAQDMESK